MNIEKPLFVGTPNIGDRQVFDQLVDEIFERKWFTNMGTVERAFEEKLCEYLNVKHCIPVCNATVGLQLVCHALDLRGQVIVPAFTFVATPHAIQWEGLEPVFADSDMVTHCICPNSVESLINENTSAIFAVHLWGHPCDTDRLSELSAQHNLKLVFDAAHAFGCSHQGKMVGNFGDCEVFSFHATKFFNTFEGGAIATNDDVLAKKIRLVKNFGFSGMDNVVHLGTNAKMTEICAAMGISVFAKLEEILSRNYLNYNIYKNRLKDRNGIRFYELDHLERTNWQYIVIEIDENNSNVCRDELFQLLHENNVLARRYFFPGCHNMEPYRSMRSNREMSKQLPNCEALCSRTLCLPTGTGVADHEIEAICDLILKAVQA